MPETLGGWLQSEGCWPLSKKMRIFLKHMWASSEEIYTLPSHRVHINRWENGFFRWPGRYWHIKWTIRMWKDGRRPVVLAEARQLTELAPWSVAESVVLWNLEQLPHKFSRGEGEGSMGRMSESVHGRVSLLRRSEPCRRGRHVNKAGLLLWVEWIGQCGQP